MLIFFWYGSHIKKYIHPYFVGILSAVFKRINGKISYPMAKDLFRNRAKSPSAKVFGPFLCKVFNFIQKSPIRAILLHKKAPPPGWGRWRGFGETGKVSAAFRGDQAFAALFLVAWKKMASMATAKRTPTGYATAVL